MGTNEWAWNLSEGWRELEAAPVDWASAQEMHTVLEAAGYRRDLTELDEAVEWLPGGPTIWVWHSQGEGAAPTGYRYYCEVTLPASEVLSVWLPDAPTLLDFLRTYSGMAWQQECANRLRDLMEAVEKVFKLWHGHDFYSVCLECDPDQYRRLQEANRRWRARQAQQSAAKEMP